MVEKGRVPRISAPVVIHIHSRRHRLADIDGICAKYVIDQLVTEEVLQDDSPAFVKEVRFSQEKIPKECSEETIITLIKASH